MSAMLGRVRPVGGLLVLANIALVSWLGVMLWRGTQIDELLAVTPAAIKLSEHTIEFTRSNQDYTVVRTRPLFYSSREFYVAPDPALAVPALPKPNYRLTGTIGTPQKGTVALLVPEGGTTARKVVVGDVLDGWTVKVVEPTRVRVEAGSETFEIVSGKRTSGIGMTVKSLERANASTNSGGIRVLGSGGTLTSNVSASGGLISTPRLYRPPL